MSAISENNLEILRTCHRMVDPESALKQHVKNQNAKLAQYEELPKMVTMPFKLPEIIVEDGSKPKKPGLLARAKKGLVSLFSTKRKKKTQQEITKEKIETVLPDKFPAVATRGAQIKSLEGSSNDLVIGFRTFGQLVSQLPRS